RAHVRTHQPRAALRFVNSRDALKTERFDQLRVSARDVAKNFMLHWRRPPGTRRFQRAVSAKDLLIGIRRPRSRSVCVGRLLLNPVPCALRAFNGSATHDCALEATRTQDFHLITSVTTCG